MKPAGSEVEFAWAAGLFEGEGYITVNNRHQRAVAIRLGLKMTDEECVRRFHAALGCGYVIGPQNPPSRKSHWSVTWEWRCIRDGEADSAINRLWPFLSTRRRTRVEEIRRLRADALLHLDHVCRCGSRFRALRANHVYCSPRCATWFWKRDQVAA